MKRRILYPISIVAPLALLACVTVNVYFPAAEIKDLSRKIEEEVRKEAAKTASDAQQQPAPEPAEPQKPAPEPPDGGKPGARTDASESMRGSGLASLLEPLLGITPAYAGGDAMGTPDVTSPAIRKIIDSRAARADALNKYKALGAIGESNQALIEVRNLEAAADLKARAEIQRLVKAENADREELFREIAVAKKVDPGQLPKIRETYAATLRDLARAGDWIQAPDGTWKKK